MKNHLKSSRVVIVSNRLPFKIEVKENKPLIKPAEGGLITALAPVLKDRGGIWVGWPGGLGVEEANLNTLVKVAQKEAGFTFLPVLLSKEEVDLFYHGFSNEIIWPLFHDLQTLCRFNPEYWRGYCEVNAKFAEEIAARISSKDFIWVQDYQLILLGQELRRKKVHSKIGYFLHIPFPPVDIFMKLPWRFQILRAMLDYDLIGFQTVRDCRNFINCIRLLKKEIHLQRSGPMYICSKGSHQARIGAFPIGINCSEFTDVAALPETAEAARELHRKWPHQKLVLSVDRLDYTKGIIERLEAIRIFLNKYPEFHKKVSFVQVVIPSRIDIPGYHTCKQEIDRLVGEINSQFTHQNWVPIQYQYYSLPRLELLAYYRTADVALVTSLKDGMNLVSKEYVACQIEKKGVLILSEFAGSASQFQNGALLIHPYDAEGIADAIHQALTMPEKERRKRMQLLQYNVKRYDIFWWMRACIAASQM